VHSGNGMLGVLKVLGDLFDGSEELNWASHGLCCLPILPVLKGVYKSCVALPKDEPAIP